MQSSRIAGARRRVVLARRSAAVLAAALFGVSFGLIRHGHVGGTGTATTPAEGSQSAVQDSSHDDADDDGFFSGGSPGLAPSGGSAPSVGSSTS